MKTNGKKIKMKHLKRYKIFESHEEDITDTFSSIVYDPKIVTIPYNEFNIYALYGEKAESDKHNLLKELYYYRDTIKSIYNKDYFFISLRGNKVVIILKDYRHEDNRECYLNYLKTYVLTGQLPLEIFHIIMRDANKNTNELTEGIHSDDESSNMALFAWIYEK